MSSRETFIPADTQVVAIGAASVQSTAIAGTKRAAVRLVATVDCHIAISKAPTATATSMLLAANQPEYFKLCDDYKIAVIQDAAAGSLYITEMDE